MFCPNCGNDCKDAKFCIKCGAKNQYEEVTKSPNVVWSVGMPFPHCGGTKPNGNNYAFCGAQLLRAERLENENNDLEIDFYETPIARCRNFPTLFLKKSALLFTRKRCLTL